MTDDTRTESGELKHWVSPDPFEPHEAETLTADQERLYMASQWTMM